MEEKEYIAQLDESQKRVVTANGGYHLVLAPPGCGKTHTLAERICYAHERGVDYDDMLCLTFTNRASREMLNRINARIDDPSVVDLQVGNVHRYCSKFLFDAEQVSADSSVIDDEEAVSIIADYMHEDDETVLGDWGRYRVYQEIIFFQHLMYQIEHNHPLRVYLHPESFTEDNRLGLKKICELQKFELNTHSMVEIYHDAYNYIDDANAPHINRDIARKIRNVALKMYYARMYEQYKQDNNMLDFEDLLLKTFDAYTEDKAKPESERSLKYYHWIQVDEVQDLNEMQLAIIDLLTADKDYTVMYLGDEQQAIFSFMGAKMETLMELRMRCKENIHHLTKNHRSPSYLLDVFNDYASKTLKIKPDLLPTTDRIVKATPNDLRIIATTTIDNEIEKVAEIAGWLLKKYPDERTAVIVSSNRDADSISDEMTRRQLSHFKVSGKDLFSTNEMKLLLAHLNVVSNELNFISWARVLKGMKVFRTNSLARRFLRKLKALSLTPADFIDYEHSSYILEFIKAYQGGDVVVFDTETTGLDVFDDDIIEISAIRVRNGKEVAESLDLYISTDKEIPEKLGDKTNPMFTIYKQKESAGQLLSHKEALRKFLDFIGDVPIIGHNVNFDYNILDNNMKRYMGDSIRNHPNISFDTLKLMHLLVPNLTNYRLESLLAAFHLEGKNSHQAIDDTAATVSLLVFCYNRALEKAQAQQSFINHTKVIPFGDKLRRNYSELYNRTKGNLYKPVSTAVPPLLAELKDDYQYLLDGEFIKDLPKFNYVLEYVSGDTLEPEFRHRPLLDQLSRYLIDLNTLKEADFCNSKSIKEKIYVTTVHKAKGLEFDNVIVFDAANGRYPNYFNKNKKQTDEDARKFYVAISRAQERLYIAYAMQQIDKYGRVHEREITPFMNDIMNHFNQ